jgi:hypothetical protein
MAKESLTLVERGEAKRRQVGLEEADRMRVEGGDNYRPPLVEGAGDGAPHDRLVAEMESVEIAERDDAPLKVVGDPAVEGEPLHCRGP